MNWTLLHVNGFDAIGGAGDDYTSQEVYSDYSPVYVGGSGWSGRVSYYSGYGKILWCWASSWWVSPALLSGPYSRIGIHALFGFDSMAGSPLEIVRFWDSVNGASQMTLRLVPNGSFYDLQARRGSTTVGTAPQVYQPGPSNWLFLSALLEVSSSSGRLRVLGGFNDQLLIDYTGPTQATSRPWVDRIFAGSLNAGMTGALDDLILYTASDAADVMPRMRVIGHIPPTADVQQQWTRASGSSNRMMVATPEPYSTNYVAGRQAGLEDFYQVALPSFTGRIAYAGTGVRAAASEPGPQRSMRLLVQTAPGSYQSDVRAVPPTLISRSLLELSSRNPATGKFWTLADLQTGWRIGFRLE